MKTFVALAGIGVVAWVGSVEGQAPGPTEIQTQRPVSVAGPISLKPAKRHRVVDLKRGSFVIDEAGTWVLNRNWRFEDAGDMAPILIGVAADGVVLDFRGFEIEVEGVGGNPSVTVIDVEGDGFTLKNAKISICCDGGSALRSTGHATRVDGLSGFSFEPIALEGSGAVLRNSMVHARSGVAVWSSGTIENTFISCRAGCVSFVEDGNKLLNSRIMPDDFLGVLIGGNGNVLAGNLIEKADSGPELTVAFDVRGDRNVLRDNTLVSAGVTSVAVQVSGTGNVIDGNVAARQGEAGGVGTGVRFEQDGNFYGDNRMNATLPFDLGATTQIDWAGNVGF